MGDKVGVGLGLAADAVGDNNQQLVKQTSRVLPECFAALGAAALVDVGEECISAAPCLSKGLLVFADLLEHCKGRSRRLFELSFLFS